MPEPEITAAVAAERLGVSVKTIHRMVDDGRLTPALKFPGLRGPYLFTEEEIARAAAAPVAPEAASA
jgi:excisionase family DNA binding protein